MPPQADKQHPTGHLDVVRSVRRFLTPSGWRRVAELALLTTREAVRSRVLVGAVALMVLLGLGSLLWPQASDAGRVIVVQRLCYGGLTFFGLIVAAFVGGSALHRDIVTKRIYTLATKPLSRLEIVLGKTAGLILLLALFLFFGGLITYGVTHIANMRKTFEGGSYELEVIAPTARLEPDDPTVEEERLILRQGQMLEAIGKTEDKYKARIAGRHTELAGTIPKDVVRLHERTLAPERVVGGRELGARAQGRARWGVGELTLAVGELARNETWHFDLPEEQDRTDEETIRTRITVGHLRHEPLRGVDRTQHQPPRIEFNFYNPGEEDPARVSKVVDFVFSEQESRRDPDEWPAYDYYYGIVALPRRLATDGVLAAEVVNVRPHYRALGRIFVRRGKEPRWRAGPVSPRALPEEQATFRTRFHVQARTGLDLLDYAAVTAIIRNPATGEQVERPMRLRNLTVSYVRFPSHLIDPEQGVDFVLTDIPGDAQIGYQADEPPIYLILEPDQFAASTIRSVALIFFQLSIFATIAVAASTILSAPVAILFTLVVAMAGGIKDLLLEEMGRRAVPAAAALQQMTPTERAWHWIEYLYQQILIWAAPGFSQFSSAEFINRQWTVPWSVLATAVLIALGYSVVFFAFGYLFLSARELE